jgi:hypothetical protein
MGLIQAVCGTRLAMACPRFPTGTGSEPDVDARIGAGTTIDLSVYFIPHVVTIGFFAKTVLDVNQTNLAVP